jgi:hypothetical protein
LTEAKQAVVEALLQLAIQRCTGEGEEGEFVSACSARRLYLPPHFQTSTDRANAATATFLSAASTLSLETHAY